MVDIGSLAPRGERVHAEQISVASGTSRLQCAVLQVSSMHEHLSHLTLLLQMCA
jgi:hypothetical protein